MLSRILTSQAGRFAAISLAGTGAIMSGAEVAKEMNLLKRDDFPTVLKVGAVGCAAIVGAALSPLYVPARVYQIRKDQISKAQ